MLTVTCLSCGASAQTSNAAWPDDALVCPCCPEPHGHGANALLTGVPCRPVRITWNAPALMVRTVP